MTVEWTIRQAVGFLVSSVCLTLLLSFGGYWAWCNHREKKLHNEKYRLLSIVQTGPEREALKTVYLAELLGLSIDVPISIYAFDCRAGEKRLLSSPLIKSARIKRILPNAIYIDYEVRKPLAWLADYKNIAIDEQGYLFPFSPFFPPKEMPEIYLGLPPFSAAEDAMGRRGGQWLVPLENAFLKIALDIIHFLEEVPWREKFRVKRIDVSNAFAPSLGQREVVLFTEEEFLMQGRYNFPKILRIAPHDFRKQLNHFFLLRKNMELAYYEQLRSIPNLIEHHLNTADSHLTSVRFSPRIIDLRIPQLAFVQN